VQLRIVSSCCVIEVSMVAKRRSSSKEEAHIDRNYFGDRASARPIIEVEINGPGAPPDTVQQSLERIVGADARQCSSGKP
jgi:hypothetical protein